MKALIFTGGLHPSKASFDSIIQNISDFNIIIAADSGFDTAIHFGISCDIVVGDMDSIQEKDLLKCFPTEKIIEFPSDKDFTDTELALFEAKKIGATNVVLVGGDGGRLDHTLALLKVFEGEMYPNVWLCKEQIVYVLNSETTNKSSFFLRENDTISIFSVGNRGKIHSEGLKWELDSVNWSKGAYSVSNRASKCSNELYKEVTLHAEAGRFLVIMPYQTA